jgi:hypothetical protein
LALGRPASKLVELYQKNGREIFPPRPGGMLWALGGPKYRSSALSRALKREFGSDTLDDVLTRICIPAVEIHTGRTRVYKTAHDDRFYRDRTLPAWKVGLATAAAPFYFQAAEVETGRPALDGGLWANNPAMVGVAEALFLKKSLRAVHLLSVGTGETRFTMDPDKARRAGALHWAQNIIDVLFQVQSEAVHNTLSYMPLGNYVRVNCDLKSANEFRLDDARSTRIRALIGLGKTTAQKFGRAALAFCTGEPRGWKSPHAPGPAT